MKKKIFFLWTVILFTISAKGQNLFFVGEKSYPCTESYVLHSNSNENFINDLSIVFAKDKNTPLIGIRTKTENVQISGKLIIYLDDGTVISLTDSRFFDYVDKITSSVYLLSEEDLDKIKKSNINTIRFTLLDEYGSEGAFGGNFSATNKSKIYFSKIVSEFFEEKKKKLDALIGGVSKSEGSETGSEGNDNKSGDKGQLDGNTYAPSYFGGQGTGSGGVGYGLNGRGKASFKRLKQDCNESGMVVVKIIVNQSGNVISAEPGQRGTTNTAQCLLEPAKKIAMSHKWPSDSKAPTSQIGFVSVNFKLSQ